MTGNKISWAFKSRRGAEQDVCEAMRDLGAVAHAPQVLLYERRNNDRRPRRWYDQVWPKLIVARGPARSYYRCWDIKDVLRGHLYISAMVWEKQIEPWVERCANAVSMTERMIEAGEIADQYEIGESLLIREGPFRDRLAKFCGVQETEEALFPKLRMQVQIMGKDVEVPVDPLDVKRTG